MFIKYLSRESYQLPVEKCQLVTRVPGDLLQMHIKYDKYQLAEVIINRSNRYRLPKFSEHLFVIVYVLGILPTRRCCSFSK